MERSASGLREFFGLRRNLVLLLIAIVAIGAGEETWMRFVPKYLESLGAAALVIGLYDGLKTLLGAVYAYPGGIAVDRWGTAGRWWHSRRYRSRVTCWCC